MSEINPHIGIPLDDFFKENENLVWYVVHKFKNQSRDDLFQEASVEFVKCYRKFDSVKSKHFSTIAIPSMYGVIQSYIRDKTRVMRLSRPVHEIWALANKYDLDENDIDELVELSGKERRTVISAMQRFSRSNLLRLDQPFQVDDEVSLHDVIPGYFDFSEVEVEEFFGVLTKKEREILRMTTQGYRQREISKRINHSQAHISRLMKKIREKAEAFYGEVV